MVEITLHSRAVPSAFSRHAAITPDGSRVALARGNDQVDVYELPGGHLGFHREFADGSVETLALSADGAVVAIALDEGRVVLWNLARDESWEHRFPGKGSTALALWPDGHRCVATWRGSTSVREEVDGMVSMHSEPAQTSTFIEIVDGRVVRSIEFDGLCKRLALAGEHEAWLQLQTGATRQLEAWCFDGDHCVRTVLTTDRRSDGLTDLECFDAAHRRFVMRTPARSWSVVDPDASAAVELADSARMTPIGFTAEGQLVTARGSLFRCYDTHSGAYTAIEVPSEIAPRPFALAAISHHVVARTEEADDLIVSLGESTHPVRVLVNSVFVEGDIKTSASGRVTVTTKRSVSTYRHVLQHKGAGTVEASFPRVVFADNDAHLELDYVALDGGEFLARSPTGWFASPNAFASGFICSGGRAFASHEVAAAAVGQPDAATLAGFNHAVTDASKPSGTKHTRAAKPKKAAKAKKPSATRAKRAAKPKRRH